MNPADSQAVANEAKRLYNSRYRAEMEANHRGKYLCLEPRSGDGFLGDTLDEAINAALDKHPGRLTHTLRIGHSAALHLGVLHR